MFDWLSFMGPSSEKLTRRIPMGNGVIVVHSRLWWEEYTPLLVQRVTRARWRYLGARVEHFSSRRAEGAVCRRPPCALLLIPRCVLVCRPEGRCSSERIPTAVGSTRT